MVELFRGRRLETRHVATLWVDPGHDMLDGPVLAGSVHGLENDEQGILVLRIKNFLEFGNTLYIACKFFQSTGLVVKAASEIRIEVLLQRDLAARLDSYVLQPKFDAALVRDGEFSLGVEVDISSRMSGKNIATDAPHPM